MMGVEVSAPVVSSFCLPCVREKLAGVAPVAVKAKLPDVPAGRVSLTMVSLPTTWMGTFIPELALHFEGEPASTQAAAGDSQVALAFCCQVIVAGSRRLPFWSGTHRTLTVPRLTVASLLLLFRSPQKLPFRSASGSGLFGRP